MNEIIYVTEKEIKEEIKKDKKRYKNAIRILYGYLNYTTLIIDKYKNGYRWIIKDLEMIHGKSKPYSTFEEAYNIAIEQFEIIDKENSRWLILVDDKAKQKNDDKEKELNEVISSINKEFIPNSNKNSCNKISTNSIRKKDNLFDTSQIIFPTYITKKYKIKSSLLNETHKLSNKDRIIQNFISISKKVIKKLKLKYYDVNYLDICLDEGNLGPNYIVLKNGERILIDFYELINSDENPDEINMLMENESIWDDFDVIDMENEIKEKSRKYFSKYSK